jgi:predicted dehydrogenase
MSSDTPLRVGVIGLGFFGERHARIYASLPNAKLVAVCDKDHERANAVGSTLGATALTDADTLLARDDIDAVSICLPDRLHVDAAVAAARRGKAILLEKPLAHDYEAARKIVDAAETSGARLMVGHILRFDPRYTSVAAAAAPENLGRPIHLRAKRNATQSTARRLGASSSILFYMGVHDIDAMQWIGRSLITRVYAQKVELQGTGNEDALYAVVNFDNGAIGVLDYSWAWPDGLMNGYRAAFDIVGSKSAAYLDVSDQGFGLVTDAGTTGADTHLWPEVNGRIAGDLADELAHFVTAVATGAPFIQHHTEALAAIPVLDALRRSATSGSPETVRR